MQQSSNKATIAKLKPCSQCCIWQHEPANRTTICCSEIITVNYFNIICGVSVCLLCVKAFDCAGIPRCYEHSPLALSKENESETDKEDFVGVVSTTAEVVSETTVDRAGLVTMQVPGEGDLPSKEEMTKWWTLARVKEYLIARGLRGGKASRVKKYSGIEELLVWKQKQLLRKLRIPSADEDAILDSHEAAVRVVSCLREAGVPLPTDDDNAACLAVGTFLLSTEVTNGYLVGAAVALYIKENVEEEEQPVDITVSSTGRVPDALNANEYARLLHCVFDNRSAGSLKKITEGLEHWDLDATNSEAYEDPWDMITELFDDLENDFEHAGPTNADIKDINPNDVRIGRASAVLKTAYAKIRGEYSIIYSKFEASGQQGSEDKHGRLSFKDPAGDNSSCDSITNETNKSNKEQSSAQFSAFSCHSKKIGQNVLDYKFLKFLFYRKNPHAVWVIGESQDYSLHPEAPWWVQQQVAWIAAACQQSHRRRSHVNLGPQCPSEATLHWIECGRVVVSTCLS